MYAERTCLVRNASKTEVHKVKIVTELVYKRCFNMDAFNKIRVVDQDSRRMNKTHSGGVREPSDPKHYPTLGGIEGAVGTSTPQRTLPKLGSFKETLMSRPDIHKVQIGREDASEASPSSSPIELQRTRRTADTTDAPAPASPKIAAGRFFQGDESASQAGDGGAGYVGSVTSSQQVS